MRYTDSRFSPTPPDDFAPRKRLPTFTQFALLFIVHVTVICGAHVLTESLAAFLAVTFAALGVADALLVWSVQRSRDQMLATEFQNALYASALGLDNQFFLIARHDGTVVDVDAGFRAMYPQFLRMPNRTLDAALQTANASKEEIEKICHRVASRTAGQEIITLRDADGLAHRTMLSIDPIHRPTGHVLLRGRAYVEARGA